MTLRPHATPSTPHVITSSGMTEVLRDGRFYLICGVTDPERAEALVTERIERGEMGLVLENENA